MSKEKVFSVGEDLSSYYFTSSYIEMGSWKRLKKELQ